MSILEESEVCGGRWRHGVVDRWDLYLTCRGCLTQGMFLNVSSRKHSGNKQMGINTNPIET
jgi:hypothetical protein